jgi:hypothetical protein
MPPLVLDSGTAAPGNRRAEDRLEEALSGSIHPALPLHAALGEVLAARLEALAR